MRCRFTCWRRVRFRPIPTLSSSRACRVRPTASASLLAINLLVGGLFKKYILANFIEKTFLTGFRAMGLFSLEAQLNYIWVYLDFSPTATLRRAWGA